MVLQLSNVSLPSDCWNSILAQMNKKQLEAFMRTSKDAREIYLRCENLAMKKYFELLLPEYRLVQPIPMNWKFLENEGKYLCCHANFPL